LQSPLVTSRAESLSNSVIFEKEPIRSVAYKQRVDTSNVSRNHLKSSRTSQKNQDEEDILSKRNPFEEAAQTTDLNYGIYMIERNLL